MSWLIQRFLQLSATTVGKMTGKFTLTELDKGLTEQITRQCWTKSSRYVVIQSMRVPPTPAQVLESIFPDELESEPHLCHMLLTSDVPELGDDSLRIRVEPDEPSSSHPRESCPTGVPRAH